MNWNNGIFVNRKECNGICKGSTLLPIYPPTFCHHQSTCLICFTSVFPSHLSYSQSHHIPHLLLQVTLLFNLSSFSFFECHFRFNFFLHLWFLFISLVIFYPSTFHHHQSTCPFAISLSSSSMAFPPPSYLKVSLKFGFYFVNLFCFVFK